MYFIGVSSTSPYAVSMDTLYVFDAATRLMTQCAVTRVHDDIKEPVMRIRCGAVGGGERWGGGVAAAVGVWRGRAGLGVLARGWGGGERGVCRSINAIPQLTQPHKRNPTPKPNQPNPPPPTTRSPEGITIEEAAKAPPLWAILAENEWHDPVPEPDELGYDASKHSPEALRRAYEAFAGKSRAETVAAVEAAVGEGEGDGMGIEDGPEWDERVEEMPDTPAIDMM